MVGATRVQSYGRLPEYSHTRVQSYCRLPEYSHTVGYEGICFLTLNVVLIFLWRCIWKALYVEPRGTCGISVGWSMRPLTEQNTLSPHFRLLVCCSRRGDRHSAVIQKMLWFHQFFLTMFLFLSGLFIIFTRLSDFEKHSKHKTPQSTLTYIVFVQRFRCNIWRSWLLPLRQRL